MILNLAILYPYKVVSRYISWGFYWVIHVSYELLQFLKNTSQINPATYFYVSRSDDIVKIVIYLLWLSFMGFPRLSFRGFPLVFLLIFVRLHISWITWKRQTITQVEHIYTVYLIIRVSQTLRKLGKCDFFCLFQVNVLRFQKFLITNNTWYNFCVLNILLFKSYDRV